MFLATICPQCKHITISDNRHYPAKLSRHGCAFCSHPYVRIVRAKSLDALLPAARDDIEQYLEELGDDFGRDYLLKQLTRARERYADRKEGGLEIERAARRRLHEAAARDRRKASRRAKAIAEGRAAIITHEALKAARATALEAGRPARLNIKCPRCQESNRCSANGYGRGHCRKCNAWWVVQKAGEEATPPPSPNQLTPRELRIRLANDPALRRQREQDATTELKAIHEEWKQRQKHRRSTK